MAWQEKLLEYGVLGILVLVCFLVIYRLYERTEKNHLNCVEDTKSLRTQVETLHASRAADSKAIFDHMATMLAKSEESKYATIAAITNQNNATVRLEQAVQKLIERSEENSKDLLKALHDRA